MSQGNTSSKRTGVITLGIGVAALVAVVIVAGPKLFGETEGGDQPSSQTPAAEVEQSLSEQAPE